MIPKNYGQLLFNAVRETLETMAFAEVIPCSIKVGDEEFTQSDEDFSVGGDAGGAATGGWGDDTAVADSGDAWGTAMSEPAVEPAMIGGSDSWGSDDEDAPGADEPPTADDGGGEPATAPPVADGWGDSSDDAWGTSGIAPPAADPWGESTSLGSQVEGMAITPREVDFDQMVENQDDWCWACMKVNSPEVHSVWFIVSKGLARALAENMYAGEAFELDNPLIRDLISELTNVLGGRLMLLLEEMGGQFTLTVPEIGFGMPQIPETQVLETVLCKVVVDGEFPVIVALCFNQGAIAAMDKQNA